jgi:hypothetical protein
MTSDYEKQLASAGALAQDVDRLLRDFASRHGIKTESPTGSLKLRGHDRRSVVFQPDLAGKKASGLRVQFHHVTDEWKQDESEMDYGRLVERLSASTR